jgi:glutamate dehydrogenase
MSMTPDAGHETAPDPGPPQEAVEDLCRHLRETQDGDTTLLCRFARIFFAKVPSQLIEARSLEDLAAMTVGAFRFLEVPDPAPIRVAAADPAAEGWVAPVTVIRTLVGDRPFIVDTIREFLGSEKISIQHYMYPVLGVERNEAGELTGVSRPGSGDRVSLVHCEIQRMVNGERLGRVVAEIHRRLEQVVAVTDDFEPMLEALRATMRTVQVHEDEAADRSAEHAAEHAEILEFLQWLERGNFVFLGYREYDIAGDSEGPTLEVRHGSGLGILRREESSAYAAGVPLTDLRPELVQRLTEGPVLIINKTNAESPIHRRARMDYVGIKKLDAQGAVVGERRFLGLFTSQAYSESAEEIPILRRKLHWILDRSDAPAGSHDYKEIITIFNSMPKEDLFQTAVEDLEREVQAILGHLFAAGVRVLLRRDPLARGAIVIVILPQGRFSGEVQHRIEKIITRHLDGTVLNQHVALGSADQVRLHFYISASREAVQAADRVALEREITHITRSWEDRLMDALTEAHGDDDARRLWDLYASAFSEEYRVAFLPAAGVVDIEQLERMRVEDRQMAIAFSVPRGRGRAEEFQRVTILKLYLKDQRMVLSDFMPILENSALRVIELAPFVVSGAGLPDFMIYSFAVQGPGGAALDMDRAGILAESLMAVRVGDSPDDLFNSLVLAAGLRWREVDLLRAYANFAFQADAVPSRLSPARALLRHPQIAKLLVALIGAKFDPAPRLSLPDGWQTDPVDALRGAITGALEGVSSLADDRAIRRLLSLVLATTRTNYFRHGGPDPTYRSGGVPYISIKIKCTDVEELRHSRLLYEIFVHSARMAGIHLRGAVVSRGGIRWSDRPDDFRTEVLGLVQTQVVKNAVIVPGGSKGGFITRRVFENRDESMAEAAEQYRTLIRGMLDITDNIVHGEVVPPPGVVRHDGDDPYLVVAADKGTAHLSDTANEVAAEYAFWLGDAFASGGSYGYDHKKEGITARGAWECVKRHFWELGKDIQEEPFTVAGIGDMSGDVFGNGMLLSRQIRLVAAFDHRHIFLDPDPDPETSCAERERLFALGRSTWDDYDRSLLSPGGMIVPRGSKELTLTPEVRRALGVEDLAGEMDGEALVRAVLRAPVELLWNGGIGTYVKDVDETHGEVGDPGNDAVRINATELRCHVIGEGGNLGMTQRARIRFALAGGRLNTDALDNAAGVDMSDHEVNLKILLNAPVSAGTMTLEERNDLLAGMTEGVTERVLRNSRGQSLAVSLDERRSRDALQDFAALITAFERDRLLERGSEGLPSSETIRERAESGLGLTRPAISVLLAYAKLHAKSHVLASSLPDDPALFPLLQRYFPPEAVAVVGDETLRGHRLRREIIVTELVNDLVNLMGASFLHRVARDTGTDIATVVRAWVIASGVSGAEEIRRDLAVIRSRFPAQVVYRWLHGLGRVLERTTHWAMANVDPHAAAAAVIDDQRDGLARLRGEFAGLVAGEDRELFVARLQELEELGVEHSFAQRLITLRFMPQLLDILRIAHEGGHDAVETARAYYLVSDRFACAALRAALRTAAREERWEKRFAEGLVEDLGRAHRGLTRGMLACLPRAGSNEACLREINETRPREVAAYREVLDELNTTEGATLAGYAVAVRLLREIARG